MDYSIHQVSNDDDQVSPQVLKLLRKCTILPTVVAQGTGYFPFTCSSDKNKLHFSPRNVHFINLIFHSVVGTICPLFCIYNMDVHERLASDWSTTEKFAYGMIFNIISISKGLIRGFSLTQRSEIMKFHTKFNATLVHIFSTHIKRQASSEDNYSTTRSYERKQNLAISALERLLSQKVQQPLGCVWILLIVLESLVFPMIVILLVRFVNDGVALDKKDLSVGKVAICMGAMALCMLTGVLYSTFLYWLVAIIHCMEVGFLLLGEDTGISEGGGAGSTPSTSTIAITFPSECLDLGVEEGNVTTEAGNLLELCPISSNETTIRGQKRSEGRGDLAIFATNFSLLEALVKEFNAVFKYHISVILLGCCCSWVLHSFVLINAGMKEGIHFMGTLVLALWTILDTVGIVSICNASSQLAHQVCWGFLDFLGKHESKANFKLILIQAQRSIELMRDEAVKHLDTDLVNAIRVLIWTTFAIL